MRKAFLCILVMLMCSALWAVDLEVIVPPGSSNNTALIQKYLAANPSVSGFDLYVQWADFDKGGRYDFSGTDQALAPWFKTGKKVNIIVWANSNGGGTTCTNGGANGTGNCSIPSYVWPLLGASNYVTCTTQAGNQRLPNYLSPAFSGSYKLAMKALAGHFGSMHGIGYIRFGLGHGGETLPGAGWNSPTTACGKAFAKWGVTIVSWEAYLKNMLEFEGSLKSPNFQLMVGITPMGVPSTQVPDFVAGVAELLGIGFGSQGLEKSDVNNCKGSTADWCNLFVLYPKVPHELQTLFQSCQNNSCTTGSLTVLLPWATAHGATLIELYYQDWLTAFDPSYPGYTATYAKAIQAAAASK